jgi:hypothetical protein
MHIRGKVLKKDCFKGNCEKVLIPTIIGNRRAYEFILWNMRMETFLLWINSYGSYLAMTLMGAIVLQEDTQWGYILVVYFV